MRLSETNYLLEMNFAVALLSENHVHHQLVTAWFNAPDRQWSICSFTEAGFLRNATAPRPGQITMTEATVLLQQLAQHPGCHYLPITADRQALCGPLFRRLYGTKQVTGAYLLGLAVQSGLVLVTMDKAIARLAGMEQSEQVLVLTDG